MEGKAMSARLDLVLLSFAVLISPVLSDPVISKVERRIDLTSQAVRISSTLKVENEGNDVISKVMLTFPELQAKKMAYLMASLHEGRGKTKGPTVNLPVEFVHPEGMPPALNVCSVYLPKGLGKDEVMTLDILAVFTHSLQPFPEKITQADIQLVVFQESAYYLSPYAVKAQSLSVKLPNGRIESYTKLENSKMHGSEIKYGPYESLPPFSYSPIVFHFEINNPFAVAEELVREIEISLWGNVKVTEHYSLLHGGAQSKGEFSRLDYQAKPHLRGASAFGNLLAKLPPRAHSVYYRDEIGNISTSHLWGDSRKTELEIEPRYPMFGGWRTSFTIGYGLPLQDFLFESQGKLFLNIPFGCAITELVIDNLIVQVVLPEGSRDISAIVPFPVKQWEEIKLSHLDITGRPVAVLQKTNVVNEHNQHFQIYFRYAYLNLLREPLILISGFFFFFIACIAYVRVDMSISKSSPSYMAKLQWDDVQAAVQRIQTIIRRCLAIHNKLEASLRELSRTGDVQACKMARKGADSQLKELGKELKPLMAFLHSSPQATSVLPKVEEVVGKERELQEKVMGKHAKVVDGFEKRSAGREGDAWVGPYQEKLTALRREVDDLLDVIDEI